MEYFDDKGNINKWFHNYIRLNVNGNYDVNMLFIVLCLNLVLKRRKGIN